MYSPASLPLVSLRLPPRVLFLLHFNLLPTDKPGLYRHTCLIGFKLNETVRFIGIKETGPGFRLEFNFRTRFYSAI